MQESPVLDCEGLARSFGDRVAVDGVGFSIAPGETFGLLGPNGAGKTTTISIVAGVLTPDRGTVRVCGREVTTAASAAKRAIGLVPQEIALYPDLTAAENLRFFGRLQGLSGKELERRSAHVLEVVGLADRARDRVDTYSGDMRRRANIAAGLLHDPRLLILDEPTVGVDPQSRNGILEAIDALGGEGLAVLYTTHYMEEAERLCDRIAILDEGRIIAEGTRRELIAGIDARNSIVVEASGDLDALARRAGAAAGVAAVTRDGDRLELVVDEAGRGLAALVEAAGETGARIVAVDVREPNLEDVFLRLTGRALRD